MALIGILPNGEYSNKCPLCGNTLSEPIYATSGFIIDAAEPLLRYSDAAMHWECYCAWEHQKRFASLYFEAMVKNTEPPHLPHSWRVLWRTASTLVKYGFVANAFMVFLRESGTAVRVTREDWSTWLAGEWENQCRPGLEFEALQKAIPELTNISLPQDA